jgi:hypothetical protein
VASLILVLLLVWFVVTVFLAAWTLLVQPYLYTEPVQGIAWRAPAAGTGVFLTVLLWVWLDYQAPERYSTLWEFSPDEYTDYPRLIVPHRDGKEEEFRRVRQDRGYAYRRVNRTLPTRPEKVIAVGPNGERDVFEPDRDASGKFKETGGQGVLYRDAAGRVMYEGQLGRVSTTYPGRTFLNLFLNFFHFAAWFAGLWLLLRFQWSHALGLAAATWCVMILFVMPQVLKRAEDVALRERPAATARAVGGMRLTGAG